MAENFLYYGDNLDILRRYIPDESVDLVYLDPPFKSNQTYNVLFREKNGSASAAQIRAFEDTWQWDLETRAVYEEIVEGAGPVSQFMQGMKAFIGENDMLAYLAMMAPRLMQLRQVLRRTGSIYLHCDPTASHFLKLLMDAVFGGENYCNEIVWHYRKWPTGKYVFQRNHDVILFYSRSQSRERVFNQLYMDRAPSTLKRFGTARIRSGYDANGNRVPSEVGDEESTGVRQDDAWDISRVPPIKQFYPTQKPEALLERIIRASSNEGDLVLDPFCGCGTTVVVAHRLKRRWSGIDITHLAVALMRHRLQSTFGPEVEKSYEVIGEPKDVASARALAAQDRFQFQCWALGLVSARPVEGKRGADKGIDGRLYFHDEAESKRGKTKQVTIQVKSGRVNPAHVRDLRGVVERENAEIGALVTLEEPSGQMRTESASAGFYSAPDGSRYARIQLLTISDLLRGARVHMPRWAENRTFKQAPRVKSNPVQENTLPRTQ